MICGNPIQDPWTSIQKDGFAIPIAAKALQAKRGLWLAAVDLTIPAEAGEGGSVMNRLEKQKLRQREYRARMKRQKAPSRDDVARAFLHWAVTEAIREGHREKLQRVQDEIVDRLVKHGFDFRASDDAFDAIIDRYAAGWSFQCKRHLLRRREDDPDDACAG